MVQVLFLYIENETVDCWLGLRALKTLYFYFCKVKKKKLKGFFQRILQEIMKKTILGTSNAWSMRQSFHIPNDTVYYVKDC